MPDRPVDGQHLGAHTPFEKVVARRHFALATDKPLYFAVIQYTTLIQNFIKTPKHPTLIRRSLQARPKQLQAKSPVLAASLVTIRRACGNPNCRCARDHKHPGHYLTWKVKAKTHTAYVPVDLLPEVKLWTQELRRLKQLVHQITQLSLALIQTQVTAQRRKSGRS